MSNLLSVQVDTCLRHLHSVEFCQFEYVQRLDWLRTKFQVEEGTKTLGWFREFQATPPIDYDKVRQNRRDYGQRRLPSLLMLQCYPAELMKSDELGGVAGILW